MQYQLRHIVQSKNKAKEVFGLTIPAEIAIFFEGCHFTIEKSGTCIIAVSGASVNPTKEQVEAFNFEGCRI